MTRNSIFSQQVSDKQSEMGIGQTPLFRSSRSSDKLAVLPWMYLHELYMKQRKPMKIASFETLIHPFDNSVWAFTIGCTVIIFFVLVVMQKLWSRVSGKASPNGYMFQGDVIYPGAVLI